MPKYLNRDKKEMVYWVAALAHFFGKRTDHYQGKSLTWLNSMLISFEAFLKTELNGVDETDLRAIDNMIRRCTPELVENNFFTKKESPKIEVYQSDLFDLAEYALEYCNNCKGDYGNCKLRKIMLRSGVPPYVEKGPCQYWRGTAPQKVAGVG